jgi:hypothetical protein
LNGFVLIGFICFSATNKYRDKRSDIDERLMELKAKILLTKAFAKMPAGHGKFNFHKL